MPQAVVVNVEWDPDAKVWVAESNDVPGLATGADTLEELIERLKVAIPEMLTGNGIAFEPGLRFKIEVERSESIAA
jgi:predicted RNase H-like HicB family nuclease